MPLSLMQRLYDWDFSKAWRASKIDIDIEEDLSPLEGKGE